MRTYIQNLVNRRANQSSSSSTPTSSTPQTSRPRSKPLVTSSDSSKDAPSIHEKVIRAYSNRRTADIKTKLGQLFEKSQQQHEISPSLNPIHNKHGVSLASLSRYWHSFVENDVDDHDPNGTLALAALGIQVSDVTPESSIGEGSVKSLKESEPSGSSAPQINQNPLLSQLRRTEEEEGEIEFPWDREVSTTPSESDNNLAEADEDSVAPLPTVVVAPLHTVTHTGLENYADSSYSAEGESFGSGEPEQEEITEEVHEEPTENRTLDEETCSEKEQEQQQEQRHSETVDLHMNESSGSFAETDRWLVRSSTADEPISDKKKKLVKRCWAKIGRGLKFGKK